MGKKGFLSLRMGRTKSRVWGEKESRLFSYPFLRMGRKVFETFLVSLSSYGEKSLRIPIPLYPVPLRGIGEKLFGVLYTRSFSRLFSYPFLRKGRLFSYPLKDFSTEKDSFTMR